jgi:hypothetical protein
VKPVQTSGEEVSQVVTKYHAQKTRRNFQVFRVLGSTVRRKAEEDSSSRVGKILYVVREEKGCMGACRGTWKLLVLWVRLEIGFLKPFMLPEGRNIPQVQMVISWEGEVSLANYHLLGPLAAYPPVPVASPIILFTQTQRLEGLQFEASLEK